MAESEPWWRSAVYYQVYLRSFADSNADGVGDFPGLTSMLPYLKDLGIDAIWVSPAFASPNDDFGYDVADYLTIADEYGGNAAADDFIAAAHELDLRVLFDLVPGHTSTSHAWFQASRRRQPPYDKYYIWYEGDAPPNNWVSTLGTSAWKWDGEREAWYLHNFFATQADLNWHNPHVVEEFDRILSYWFERRIDGFRIDVAHGLYKNTALRDNPAATIYDNQRDQRFGQRQIYNTEQPEAHDLYRRWRLIADRYVDRVLMGETYVLDSARLAKFYGDNDELHLIQNIMFPLAGLRLDDLAAIVHSGRCTLPDGAPWSTFISNHDISRFPTRWRTEYDIKKFALLMLLTLPCAPILYYGDELGLEDSVVWTTQDQVGRFFPPGRDPARGMFPFTASAWPKAWLDADAPRTASVASQLQDPGSVLLFTKRLIALRRRLPALRSYNYRPANAPTGCWVYARGDDVWVVLNGTVTTATADGVLSVEAASDEAVVLDRGRVELPPYSGAVVRAPRVDLRVR